MLIHHDRRDRFPWARLSLFPQGDSRPTLARDATWQLESECVCGILSLRHVEMRECIVFHSRRVACQRRFSSSSRLDRTLPLRCQSFAEREGIATLVQHFSHAIFKRKRASRTEP